MLRRRLVTCPIGHNRFALAQSEGLKVHTAAKLRGILYTWIETRLREWLVLAAGLREYTKGSSPTNAHICSFHRKRQHSRPKLAPTTGHDDVLNHCLAIVYNGTPHPVT